MKIIISILLFAISLNLHAYKTNTDSLVDKKNIKFKNFIIPTTMVVYGFSGLKVKDIRDIDLNFNSKLVQNINNKTKIDDYLQYTPAITVYFLDVMNIKAKNKLLDRTLLLAGSYLIMGTTVTSLKKITAIERPDGSAKNSFPSGHTATAFMAAEFMHQEYKHLSKWYGVSAYIIASGTGFLRMYNNRHWFSDVVCGAGIGILSTKIFYYSYPLIKKRLFKNSKKTNGFLVPYYKYQNYGIEAVLKF